MNSLIQRNAANDSVNCLFFHWLLTDACLFFFVVIYDNKRRQSIWNLVWYAWLCWLKTSSNSFSFWRANQWMDFGFQPRFPPGNGNGPKTSCFRPESSHLASKWILRVWSIHSIDLFCFAAAVIFWNHFLFAERMSLTATAGTRCRNLTVECVDTHRVVRCPSPNETVLSLSAL